MKAVKGDGRLGQVLADSCDEGLGHVHAHHLDGLGPALMALEVGRKALHGAGILACRGMDQTRARQIVHHREVAVTFGAAGLIHADAGDIRVAFLLACQADMGIDLAPQGVVRTAQNACTGGHWHLARKRQGQCLEHECEATALARPGHAQLACVATHAAGHTRQRAMHVGLELKEVQMPPAALAVVMQLLLGSRTGRAWCAAAVPGNVQVYAAALYIQRNTFHRPGRAQPKGLTKQCFLHLALSCWLAVNSIS